MKTADASGSIAGVMVSSSIERLEDRRLLSAVTPAENSVTQDSLAIVNTFAAGNGKKTQNQYPGTAGGGWSAGWSSSAKSLSAVVQSGSGKGQSLPIDQIEPNYLQVTTAGTGLIDRPYPGVGAGTNTDRVIQFDYRFDGTSHGDSASDALMIFGDNAGNFRLNQTGTVLKTDTWVIKASMNQSGAVWQFGYLNHLGKITFIDNAKSGVLVSKNDVYQFTVDENFQGASQTYTATVRDTTTGTVYQTPTGLKFVANESTTDYLDVGMSLASGETGKFSIDSIHIATKPTVAPVVFFIGGFGATQYPEPGVASVEQDYASLFTFDGIDPSNFRWYEQNYDTDTTVNPDGDSIAAEIDQVPAGTPVVLMGGSNGGAQAVTSAAEATREINDLILFDPVVKGSNFDEVNNTSTDPATDHVTQINLTLSSNVQYAADLSRVIFKSDGKLAPTPPYAFTITGTAGTYENIQFPRSTKHQAGQLTPRALTPGIGGSGDPRNDTSELVENAVDGLPLFWEGLAS